MAQFRHNKTDGWIAIGDVGSESFYDYTWWATQEPSYNLQVPYYYREYIQGCHHYLDTAVNRTVGEYPYLDGDIYISKKAQYDLDYAEYKSQSLTLEEAQSKKYRELLAKYSEVAYGDVVFNGGAGDKTYHSDPFTFESLENARVYYNEVGGFPIDYSVLDITEALITFTQTNLTDLSFLIRDLYELCTANYKVHRNAISCLATIELVDAYDISTGWVTTPYNL